MGFDLYMEAVRAEPAFKLTKILLQRIDEWAFERDGVKVIDYNKIKKFLQDYDPVWDPNAYR